MTNGEKIQQMFPNAEICIMKSNYERTKVAVDWKFEQIPSYYNLFYEDWWNAEYKEPTTKNDLGVDCISRAEAIKCLECDFDITGKENMKTVVNYINSAHDKIVNLPRVKQEPFKPMVEIDLYSVIKQKYIEREVLDKIREQIKSNLRGVEIALEVLVENHPLRPKMEGAKDTLEDCLELIDKAETEET